MNRPPLLLLALPTLLGVLHAATLAAAPAAPPPAPEVAPRAEPGPSAPAEAAGATPDEVIARVERLSEAADAAAQLAEALVATGQRLVRVEKAVAAEAAALGPYLAAARDRIAELEAGRAEDEATIARLEAELEGSRAETRALGERLEGIQRGLEGLTATLAAAAPELPEPTAEDEADRREVAEAEGVDSSATRIERQTPDGREAGAEGLRAAPAASERRLEERESAGARDEATAPESGTELESARTEGPAGDADHFAATSPVNLRAAPDNTAEVLAVVGEGEPVRGVGRRGGWLQVEYTGPDVGAVTGWVHGGFLRRVEAPPRDGGPVARADGG